MEEDALDAEALDGLAADEEDDGPLEAPSLAIAYTLWLVSVVCCACNIHLHLVYLGRYQHCVLNTLSCGWCGVSRLFELCSIPRYAAESIGEAPRGRAWRHGRTWSTLRASAAFAYAYAFGEIGRHTSSLFVELKVSSPEYFRTNAGPTGWPLRVHAAVLLGALGTACGATAVYNAGATRTNAWRVASFTLAATCGVIVMQQLDMARFPTHHVFCGPEMPLSNSAEEAWREKTGRSNQWPASTAAHCAGFTTVSKCESDDVCGWRFRYRPLAASLYWLPIIAAVASSYWSSETRSASRVRATARRRRRAPLAACCPPLLAILKGMVPYYGSSMRPVTIALTFVRINAHNLTRSFRQRHTIISLCTILIFFFLNGKSAHRIRPRGQRCGNAYGGHRRQQRYARIER